MPATVISPPAVLCDEVAACDGEVFTDSRLPLDVRADDEIAAFRRRDLVAAFSSFSRGFGISRTTSSAGLSSRRPWNDGCRRRSSEVHSLNSTSPTSSGFTQVTPRPLYPLGGFLNGDLSTFRLLSSDKSSRSDCAVNPVPTLPAYI